MQPRSRFDVVELPDFAARLSRLKQIKNPEGCISGLLIQVPLVLVVLPGIFTLLSSEKRKPRRVKEAK